MKNEPTAQRSPRGETGLLADLETLIALGLVKLELGSFLASRPPQLEQQTCGGATGKTETGAPRGLKIFLHAFLFFVFVFFVSRQTLNYEYFTHFVVLLLFGYG